MEAKVIRVNPSTTKEIVENAEKAGYYKSKGGAKLICPDCGYKQVMVFHGPKNNDEIKYDKIYACSCGWRTLFAKKTKPIKRICKTIGCNVILPKGRKSYCYHCRPHKYLNTDNDNKEVNQGDIIVM